MAILWGAYALVDGLGFMWLGFGTLLRGPAKVLSIVMGLLGMVAGLLAILRPIDSAVALTWVLGIWLIARGVVEMVASFTGHPDVSRWTLLLGGLLAVLAGILFVSYPGEVALSMMLWLGVLVLGFGIFGLVSYVMAGKELRQS